MSAESNLVSLALSSIVYFTTGSSVVIDLLAKLGIGMCYKTTTQKITEFSDTLPPQLEILQNCDIVIWYDNIQKKWGSSRTSVFDRAPKISIVTNVVAFYWSLTPTCQFSRSCNPKQWRQQTAKIKIFSLSVEQKILVDQFLRRFIEKLFNYK